MRCLWCGKMCMCSQYCLMFACTLRSQVLPTHTPPHQTKVFRRFLFFFYSCLDFSYFIHPGYCSDTPVSTNQDFIVYLLLKPERLQLQINIAIWDALCSLHFISQHHYLNAVLKPFPHSQECNCEEEKLKPTFILFCWPKSCQM